MRNKYPGTCYRCGEHVAAGDGHFELLGRKFRVQHAACAIANKGSPDAERIAHQDRVREAKANGTGKRAQRARAEIRRRADQGSQGVLVSGLELGSDSGSPTRLSGSHITEAGEEFIEFKEALADLRSLRQEHSDLNGGGPRWAQRYAEAWDKVDELFADEDEAAWSRQQEDVHG